MELIFVFSVILFQILFINFLQVVDIVRTFGVHAFMQDKVFPLFFCHQSIPAVWAVEGGLPGETVLIRREVGVTDFALHLPGFSVVAVEIGLRCAAAGTGAVLRDITGFTPGNRFNFFAIAVLKVRDQETPVPVILVDLDFGKFINFEFLVFWGVGIIISPLLERDVSADKADEPAVLLVKVLNNRK